MVVLFATAVVLALLIIDYFIQHRRHQSALVNAGSSPVLSPNLKDLLLPDGYFAAPCHLWGRLMTHGTLKIGVDPFLLYAVGTIESIQLPQKGENIRKGDVLLTLNQDGKALAVPSPLTGVVRMINPIAKKGRFSPLLEQNWILEIKPDHLSSTLRSFHIGSEAKEWLKHDLMRFHQFLTDASETDLAAFPQNGGLSAPGNLTQLNAEGWKTFAEKFLAVEP